MSILSRRTCLQRLALAIPAAGLLSGRARAADTPAPSKAESAIIAGIVKKFMTEHQVPGLSVAFARHGKPAFQAAFGMSDEAAGEALTTDHLFRIASISKPITAVGIFLLIEQGKLKTEDKVFGPAGLLVIGGTQKLTEISLHHLLTHTSGAWRNDGEDPMFRHPEMDHAELIARTLRDRPLKHAPGESYAYSNFGYCLLGRVIEKVSGKSYAGFIRESVLAPCGIGRMKIAGNTLADRVPGEVVYHGRNGEDPHRMNVRRMDAHGGWLASPTDLVKFLVRCDGGDQPSDLLKKSSFKIMMTSTQANPGYASGWAVNAVPNRWHSGSLPGTSTIAVQTSSGLCWAGFTNSRSKDLANALDRLMWDIAKSVPAWNA
jgi:CubicO group peptidase (beta-lactamase class C family)